MCQVYYIVPRVVWEVGQLWDGTSTLKIPSYLGGGAKMYRKDSMTRLKMGIGLRAVSPQLRELWEKMELTLALSDLLKGDEQFLQRVVELNDWGAEIMPTLCLETG